MIELKDWLTISAALLSPLIAIQVSVFLQHRKEKREQRFSVFRTLMATRAQTLNPAHVEALNLIDVTFYGTDKQSKAVVEACKVYLEHHNRSPINDAWSATRQTLLVDLLQKMSVSLGYDFDKVSIERTSYFPRGFGDAEFENQQIRKLLLATLKGERLLPIWVAPPSNDSPAVTAALPKDDSALTAIPAQTPDSKPT